MLLSGTLCTSFAEREGKDTQLFILHVDVHVGALIYSKHDVGLIEMCAYLMDHSPSESGLQPSESELGACDSFSQISQAMNI